MDEYYPRDRRDGAPWRLTPVAQAKVRACILAADMYARGATLPEIMEELGLGSPAAAMKTVEQGWVIAPGEDYRAGRRKAFAELNLIRREYWKMYRDPGPATTVTGAVIRDPGTGEPVPDRQVQIAALGGLRAVNEQERKLGGYDAPRQTVSITAASSLEEINAQIARVRAELGEAQREAGGDLYGEDEDEDGEDGEDGGAPALPSGPRPLPPPARKD